MSVEMDFPARLELARELIAKGEARLSQPEYDQLRVAANESRDMQALIGHTLQLANPTRGWRQFADRSPNDEQRSYLAAAVLGCLPRTCPHLRRGPPMPAFARLALRRLDCQRCLGTWRTPPAEDADVCDLCRTCLDVPYFVPLVVQSGPTLIAGDVCMDCARALGLEEVAA